MQKRIWRLRERKARVLSEDQEIGVELALWCTILQESSRRQLGQEDCSSKAPEYGLKGEFRVAHGYALFWV